MRAISSAVSMSCRQAPGGRTTALCGQGQCPAAASGPCSHQHLQHGDGWSAAGCRGCMCRVMYCPCSRCSAAAAGGRGGPGTGRGHECCSQHSCGPPANILQHSPRCPDTRDGDLTLIPRPKIVLVSISRLQQKYFICYVKLLPIT